MPDSINSVVVLEIVGKPDITNPPEISAEFNSFVDKLNINIASERQNVQIRYTLDGREPTIESKVYTKPFSINTTTNISARCFRDGMSVSRSVMKQFTKVEPQESKRVTNLQPGLLYNYYAGEWDQLPDFQTLSSQKKGIVPNFNIEERIEDEYFGFEFDGFINIPETGMYAFSTISDDGSQLFINGQLVVDNDGLHGAEEEEGLCALSKGKHHIRVTFFEKTGGNELKVYYRGPGINKQLIPDTILYFISFFGSYSNGKKN
jgi:alpha-L-fucosidase